MALEEAGSVPARRVRAGAGGVPEGREKTGRPGGRRRSSRVEGDAWEGGCAWGLGAAQEPRPRIPERKKRERADPLGEYENIGLSSHQGKDRW